MKNQNKNQNLWIMWIKAIINKTFSRFTVLILLILFQFFWMGDLVYRLGNYAEWTVIMFNIISVITALMVIYQEDNPAYKIGWIFAIGLVPIIGATGYIIFGHHRTSRRLKERIAYVKEAHQNDLKQECHIAELNNERLLNTINYINEYGPYPAWSSTKTKYYSLADEAFVDLVEDLKKAEHFIFMEYFIIGTGYMWDTIFEILKEKAKDGVDVRIIYDDVGSIRKVPYKFKKSVEEEGIKIFNFNPLRPIASFIYNNRDHRKITVIDGYIGYNGGYNISDEYINRIEKFGHWKDSGVRLEGKAVWNYTVMFLDMWNAFVSTDDDYAVFRPETHHDKPFDSDGVVQPYSDTPLDNEHLAENVYREIINQASGYVYITTPYLILDNEMITCLQLAVKRGVDVRIITPGIPDKKIVYRLNRSYYKPLVESGVKIYEYTPGFIHAKSIVSDDIKGVVGTVNFDYRSLFLHFECATMMIGSRSNYNLKRDLLETMNKSREISMEDCKHSFTGMLFDAILRVLAPLC